LRLTADVRTASSAKPAPNPIVVPHLAVGVYGGIQPERLQPMFRGVDDGPMGRFL
jgi:hypothetical protein